VVIEEHLPLLEEILDNWKKELGNDYLGYKNHLYRMINFCFALRPCYPEARQKIIIAACFHDLGIWTSHTFDYLPPSVDLAKAYLRQNNLEQWSPEIELMILMHHKLRKYQDERYLLVELFRQGDLVDFSLGLVTCGLPRAYIKSVKNRFPNAGFHKRLVQLELSWFSRHPLNPTPVLKW
jgi:hypothetical protein